MNINKKKATFFVDICIISKTASILHFALRTTQLDLTGNVTALIVKKTKQLFLMHKMS